MEYRKQLLALLPDIAARLLESNLSRDGELDRLNFLTSAAGGEIKALEESYSAMEEKISALIVENRHAKAEFKKLEYLQKLADELKAEGWGFQYSKSQWDNQLRSSVDDLRRVGNESKHGYTAMLDEMKSIVKAFALLADSALGGQTHTVKNGRLHSIKDVAETTLTRIEEMQRRDVRYWRGYTLSQGSHELRDARGQLIVLERENKKLLEQVQAAEAKKENSDAEDMPF
jgi:hypothetical protein